MKSLEHLIRDIREGKAEKGNNNSLEHAIRKIREGKRDDIDASAGKYGGFDKMNTESDLNYMGSGTGGEPKMHAEDGKKKKTDEAVGSMGTDDYQGNQFKSVRTSTPHIRPPGKSETGTEPQAPENVSRQRTLAKEKSSMTIHNKVNEQALPKGEIDPSIFLDPFAGKVLGGASPKAGKPARKTEPQKAPEPSRTEPPIKLPGGKPSPLQPGPGPKPANVPSEPIVPKPAIPDKTPPTKVPAREVPKPANVPEPAKPAAPKPSAPETPTPAPAPRELPKTIPGVAPGGLPLPVVSPQPAPVKLPDIHINPNKAPATAPVTAPATQPKVVALPTIDIGAKTKPAASPQPAAAPVPAPATPNQGSTPTTPKIPPIGMGMPIIGQIPGEERGVKWTTQPVVHRAKKHKSFSEQIERKQIENVPRKGDRKSIAYVGREEDDPKTAKEKTSRQAAYKINVIDENKKLAGIVLSTVKDKKQQMKAKTEDGVGQTSKKFEYPNGTVVDINPPMNRNTMNTIDDKMPNDHK